MRSSELFDILGEIDDKYFEEAKQPDVQHGEIIVAEASPFRSFMSIFAPIAACAAIIVAVVIGANFVSKHAGLVGPNDLDSSSGVTLSSDSSTVYETESSKTESSSDSSAPTIDDNKIRLEDYPPIDINTVPDLKGSGLETQMSQQDKLLQKATLATLKCGEYELYMLGRDIHIDKSDDPLCLYSYYMDLAVVKDGEVISSDGPHTFSVSMHQGGYQLAPFDLPNYLEYYELNGGNLVVFKYHEPGQDELWDYECTFFTIADNGELRLLMGDSGGIGGDSIGLAAYLHEGYTVDSINKILTDGDFIYKFNCENFGLNPYDAVHYTAEMNLDLSEYPMLDMEQVPDIAEITDWEQCLSKATLAEKQVGYYTLSLIGEKIRSPKQVNPNIILAENVRTVVSHNGKIVYIDESSSLEIDINYFDNEFMTTYEMNYGVVFKLPNSSTGEECFGLVKGDQIIKFDGDLTATYGVDTPAEYDEYAAPIVIAEENALILYNALKYTFDFSTSSFTASYMGTEPLILAEYSTYDKNRTDYQNKAILEEKEAGGYKFYLLGQNAKNSPDNYDEMLGTTFSVCSFTKLIVAVEKDGRLIANTDVYNPNTGHDVEMIGQLLRPFEMRDGIGFVMYCNLESSKSNPYAMIYKLENDTVTQLKYEMDYAPAPATGSPFLIEPDYTIDAENNAIVYKTYDGEEVTLTLDFANNMFSMS